MTSPAEFRVDVLVIGGGPAGLSAALTGKGRHPEKSFLLIRREEQAVTCCSIPHFLPRGRDLGKSLIPDHSLERAGIELLITEVVAIERAEKYGRLSDGRLVHYEKLVLALGSTPAIPPILGNLPVGAGLVPAQEGRPQGSPGEPLGRDKIFTVPKDAGSLERLKESLAERPRIAVLGGSLVGVEVAWELSQTGSQVTLVEALPSLLQFVYDEDLGNYVEEVLEKGGVRVQTGSRVNELVSRGSGVAVLLQGKETLPVDAAILALGYRPASDLAAQTGLEVDRGGFLITDEYGRTSDPDIFAVGDCAQKRDFLSGQPVPVMLSSVAAREGRLVGWNLYRLVLPRRLAGTIPFALLALGEACLGAVGWTERRADEEGMDVVSAAFEGTDRHPPALPGAMRQWVKLIAALEGGVLVGAEVRGGLRTGELVNLLGVAIQGHMTAYDLINLQLGSHPQLSPSPGVIPLVKAAEILVRKIERPRFFIL
jgi:NADH oxidase (H2O2-forming)